MGWSRTKPPQEHRGGGERTAIPDPTLALGPDVASWQPANLRLALLDAVLDTVDVGIAACDAEGRLTLFNDASRRFHGIPADPSIESRDWSDHFDLFEADGVTRLHPHDVPLYRVLVDGSLTGHVITIVPPGSPPRAVYCEGQQLRDSRGAVTGAMVTMTDVTSADLAAATIARERALTDSLIEHCLDAYLATDERGRVVAWNASAESLFAVTAADALGRELHTLVVSDGPVPDHGAQLRAFLRDGSEKQVARHRALAVVCHDGRRMLLDSTAWTRPTEYGWGLHAFLRKATPLDVP